MKSRKITYGSLYVCLNRCLASETPAICKFCKEPMKKVKRNAPPMEGPTLSADIFEVEA